MVNSQRNIVLNPKNGDPQSLIVPREEGISDEQAKEVFASYVRLRIVDEYPYK